MAAIMMIMRATVLAGKKANNSINTTTIVIKSILGSSKSPMLGKFILSRSLLNDTASYNHRQNHLNQEACNVSS